MIKNLKQFSLTKVVTKIVNIVPGKEKFGIYRFLPFFVLLGASLEFCMINWTVGPAKVNFYTTIKRKRAQQYLDDKEAFEKYLTQIDEIDVFVEDNDFRFYCKPYYLRLNLPGKVYDTEGEQRGVYDYDKNLFKYKLTKQTPGEIFNDLDLLTKLLTKPTKPQRHVGLIEEIESDDKNQENNQHGDDDNDGENNEEEFDEENLNENSGDEWFVEQEVNEDKNEPLLTSVKYGFALTKSNVFSKLSEEYQLLFDLPDPDNQACEERQKLRIQNENEKFNEDHYLADLYDCDYIKDALLVYKPFWLEAEEKTDLLEYTQQEIDVLKSLPKRTYLLDKNEKFYAYTGLIDILYAYCYNNRVNCGEKNVESGWTISKLSSTLSWLDVFKTIDDVLIASFRRCLTYPLYRNWELCETVLKDLISLLKQGKKQILKCLIDLRGIFNEGDCRYILNDLYIIDYCVWIQYVKDKTLSKLVESLEKLEITKEKIDLDLDLIETAAKMAIENPESDDDDTDEDSDDGTSEESGEDVSTTDEDVIKPEVKEPQLPEKPKKLIEELNDTTNTDDECSEKLASLLNLNSDTTQKTNTNKKKIIELD